MRQTLILSLLLTGLYAMYSQEDCEADPTTQSTVGQLNGAVMIQQQSRPRTPRSLGKSSTRRGSKEAAVEAGLLEIGIGNTAPFTNDGYLSVAGANDPRQMEFYMTRFINAFGLKVKKHSALLGVIPFFDGEQSTQSLAAMKDEVLRNAKKKGGWVTAADGTSVAAALRKKLELLDVSSGESAPLTEDGYRRVATSPGCNKNMDNFLRRVIAEMGLCVEDEGGVSGVATWYCGKQHLRSLARLQAEVVNASRREGTWLSMPPC